MRMERNNIMKITVYTKNKCMQCEKTKKILGDKELEFEALNIDLMTEEDKETTVNFIKEELGFSAMPVVIAEGKEPFAGFRPDKLAELGE
jgi:glutaredoxin-like protein NrdH